jgi:hypothetical protein
MAPDVEKLDINDPSLEVENLDINPEADAFAFPPPPPDNTYRAKLKSKQVNNAPFEPKKAKNGTLYLYTAIEARIIDPAGKQDDWPVFDNFVSTMVMENSGTSRVAGILKALGQPVPARTSHKDLIQRLIDVLAGEPEVQITTMWEGYCETCDKTVVKGMKRFPKAADGDSHQANMACPKDGTEVRAQARIVKYQPVAVTASA